jgi:hypothetical protein
MGQVDIPLSMPGGFKSLSAAKAHREITSKVQSLRASAEEAAQDLKEIDIAEIDSTPSDQFIDLAPGKGHVITIWDAVAAKNVENQASPQARLAQNFPADSQDSDAVSGLELNYDPATGQVRQFTADIPEGKLTQWSQAPGSHLSSTFKWEESRDDGTLQSTYFKFDDRRQVVSILDQNNETPSILGDANVNDLIGRTFQGQIPIITLG